MKDSYLADDLFDTPEAARNSFFVQVNSTQWTIGDGSGILELDRTLTRVEADARKDRDFRHGPKFSELGFLRSVAYLLKPSQTSSWDYILC